MNEAVREMTFEEEAALYEKEARELFAKENPGYEAPHINHTVRRGMRIIRKAREEIEWLSKRWISVEERLPDKKGEYLTYDQWGYGAVIKTAYWTPKYDGFDEYLRGRAIWHNYDSEYGCYELTGITHWMPLPEVPEEEV